MTVQEAIQHIQALFPPDSQYDDTRVIGRGLMENSVGNAIGYNRWRELPDADLIRLAKANLAEAGECIEPDHSPADAYLDELHANAPTPYDP